MRFPFVRTCARSRSLLSPILLPLVEFVPKYTQLLQLSAYVKRAGRYEDGGRQNGRERDREWGIELTDRLSAQLAPAIIRLHTHISIITVIMCSFKFSIFILFIIVFAFTIQMGIGRKNWIESTT